jgi:ferric-dicitrate binding protein FerR (iron transport regulator)
MHDIDWELMFRYCGNECTPEERERFEQWLAANARNREFFDAVVLGAGRVLDAPSPTPPTTPALRIPFDAPSQRRVALRAMPWRAGLTAAVIVAAIVLAKRTGLVDRIPFGRHGALSERTITTHRGERAQIKLADGSRIMLASESTVRYPADLSGPTREVTLSGEAMFAIAHDAARPFIVRADDAMVKDVGTTFDVRAYPGETHVRVVVVEGSVDLSGAEAASPTQRLRRGELGRRDARGAIEIREVDPARYIAWTDGRLLFDETPMREVAAQLARWYGTPVVIADSALSTRDFTGSFNGDALPEVLTVIAAAVHARVDWRADTARLSSLPESK